MPDTPPPDWTIAYYREQYADSVRPMLTEERSCAEVDFLLRATDYSRARWSPMCRAASAAYTYLRRARLSGGGDPPNADFIASARGQLPSDADCDLHVGDMRQAFGGPYDLVAILYHSFGFFGDDENRALLVDWAARLAPGSYLATGYLEP